MDSGDIIYLQDHDSRLWDHFRNGDQAAYTALMNNYSRILFSYGYQFCPDRDFVKDCIQEVFIELWNKRTDLKPVKAVKWYLVKSVRNRISRDKKKWNVNEHLSDDYLFTVEFNIEDRIIQDYDAGEFIKKVKATINSLPARQREIMYLRFYENMSFDEIAAIMNISRQSIHNLLQKAYKNFRSEWAILALYNCLIFLG